VFAPVRLPERLPWKDVAQGLVANGYLRIGLPQKQGAHVLADLEPLPKLPRGAKDVHLLVDRLRWKPGLEQRLTEALESAFARGDGGSCSSSARTRRPRREASAASARWMAWRPEPQPSLFSFNSPLGVCPPAAASATCSSSIPRASCPTRGRRSPRA